MKKPELLTELHTSIKTQVAIEKYIEIAFMAEYDTVIFKFNDGVKITVKIKTKDTGYYDIIDVLDLKIIKNICDNYNRKLGTHSFNIEDKTLQLNINAGYDLSANINNENEIKEEN